MYEKNPKWEIVENIDFSRRSLKDWENIYCVKLVEHSYEGLISEYEWAYHMCRDDYRPLTKDFEKLSVMEMRAMELQRDVFMGSSLEEREILNKKYIETAWVRKRLNVLS
jgi:hypothetical protein